MNKYFYTFNLMFMSCANFNILGLIYMINLQAQLFCFYAFRRKYRRIHLFVAQNSYIDLKIKRPFKYDLHIVFSYINITLSSIAFLLVVALNVTMLFEKSGVYNSKLETMVSFQLYNFRYTFFQTTARGSL